MEKQLLHPPILDRPRSWSPTQTAKLQRKALHRLRE
uniref:Uncharacterized protein n=1 Tax=Lotus japonicus TaxID=34305 RepID=I3SGG1_LOTJA|nr:unknown [Lotus japonicus]